MRDVPPALASHLAEGVTTLCRCWRLVRRDGVALGFTDHDQDLVLDGTLFAAATGLDAAEATAELGFAAGGGEVAGALVSAGLNEADILAGLYDGASVETWLVNWAAPDERMLLAIGAIGEIRRRDDAFTAELRGPAHALGTVQGRVYARTCSADLGDARCGVALDGPVFAADGTVLAFDGELTVTVAGLDGFADGFFTGGRLAWAAGDAVEVAAHRAGPDGVTLELWARSPSPPVPGDRFRVTAGCDKRLETCAAKFANVANFRGFPHLPGNDFVVAVARAGGPALDGGSLFR
ncbi:MAG: DUF2163 domain-containing protein [Methylobacteriaceae bacterium]|nr:DUF2163 domain-containing protein [Methylobacteriaceae bacterium]